MTKFEIRKNNIIKKIKNNETVLIDYVELDYLQLTNKDLYNKCEITKDGWSAIFIKLKEEN
jgi:hypothetical protein